MEQQQVKIIKSDKITEDTVVRMGKRARDRFDSETNCKLEMWYNPFISPQLLTVKQAYRNDIVPLSAKDRENAIFVSPSIYTYMTRHRNEFKDIWAASKKKTCIGSDPEFVIYMRNEDNVYMHASSVLSFDSNIGSDGPLGELRAEPGTTPDEHTENLGELIEDIYSYDNINRDKYKCRIVPYSNCHYINNPSSSHLEESIISCGGHLHFGLTRMAESINAFNSSISEILDMTITMCMHRLDKEGAIQRIVNSGYGGFGDYRNTAMNRFEYRGLSGTWLLYKDLTKIVLSIANDIVETTTSRVVENKSNPIPIIEMLPEIEPLFNNHFYEREEMFESYPDSEKKIEFTKKVLNCMEKLVTVPEFDAFRQLIESDYATYDNLNSNFINNWTSGISVFDHLNKNKKKEI